MPFKELFVEMSKVKLKPLMAPTKVPQAGSREADLPTPAASEPVLTWCRLSVQEPPGSPVAALQGGSGAGSQWV